jgi:DNA-binding NarL/FixJ family response regulator
MASIRVLIADDHTLFRQGLRQICQTQDNFEVVGEAQNGVEAVTLAQILCPDIILMDISMPGRLSGIEATRHILADNPQARIIILTMYSHPQCILEAIKAGAKGYLLKDNSWQELLQTMQAVYQGESLVSSGIASNILSEHQLLGQSVEQHRLTTSEMAVLRLVAQGDSNGVIAEKLALSEKTVTNRLSDIYQKLQVENRTEAALYALRRGWVKLEQPDEPSEVVPTE